ncbi:MAG: lysylphosphatidylglycerol synthase domain-containing protein [Kofleriaceae bacterium]
MKVGGLGFAKRIAFAVIGLGVFAFFARHIDFHQLAHSLREMNPMLAIAAMVVVLIGKVGAKIFRSQRLLEAECARVGMAAPTLATTARLLYASHAAGQLAWGPLGFTVRTVALKADGLPLGTIARVHLKERIAEGAGILAVAFVAIAPLGPVQLAAALIGLVLLIDLTFTYTRATAWSFASSLADILVLALATHAMHVDAGLAPIVVGFLAINAAYLLPTPGQLGVQEAAIVLAFATAGIPAPAALACALAYRAAHLVPLAVVGIPALVATTLHRKEAIA